MNRGALSVLLTLGLLSVCSMSVADTLEIDWHTIGGGGYSSGGNLELFGTIGQPEAGPGMAGGNLQLTGGFWPGVTPPACPGDFNCDGKRDFDDIDPFVEALGTGKCKCPNFANCDPNNDGKIDFKDIDAFIPLIGVPCP